MNQLSHFSRIEDMRHLAKHVLDKNYGSYAEYRPVPYGLLHKGQVKWRNIFDDYDD